MPSITLFGQVSLDDAEQGPFGLKTWPPGQLEATLKAYAKRKKLIGWRARQKEGKEADLREKASGKRRGRVAKKDKSQWGNLGWE